MRRPRKPTVASRRRRVRPTRVRARRLALMGILVVACYGARVARAAYLQTIDSEGLRALAERQGVTTIHLGPLRGDLLDRNRERLALSATVESVSASPGRIGEAETAARRLAQVLKRPSTDLGRLLTLSLIHI